MVQTRQTILTATKILIILHSGDKIAFFYKATQHFRMIFNENFIILRMGT